MWERIRRRVDARKAAVKQRDVTGMQAG